MLCCDPGELAELAFVFEKVAHASPPSQDKLGNVLDDLGLVLGRQSGEPFGQALDI